MSKNSEGPNTATIIAAIITGIFACVAAIIGLGQPFIEKYADLYFATSTPVPTTVPLLPPAGQPTSRNLAFVDFNGGNNDIYVMNEDGSDEARLTSGAFVDDFPAWSPDGKYLAFYSGRSGNNEIYVMDANGNNLTNVTNNEANDINPSWSADGQKIVFQSNRSGNFDLHIVNLMTGQTRQITETINQVEEYPDWSPDGQHIAFSAFEINSKTSTNIYVMNVDGSGLKNITNGDGVYITPAWSPNGKLLAFTSMNDGIYLVGSDGSGFTRLTPTDIQAVDPDWSPDGQRIIFWGTTSELKVSDLFLINLDGSGLANLTNTPNRTEFGPTWVLK